MDSWRGSCGGWGESVYGLACCTEFANCRFSLAFSHGSKDLWSSWVEQGGEAAIRIWGGRGRFRRWGWRRGYLLCVWGFLGLMWICGFDVLGVHEFLLLMECSWIFGFMLLWIFVSIFLILFRWCSGVFIKLNHFCEGIFFFFLI